jgi:DNA repair protein RadC
MNETEDNQKHHASAEDLFGAPPNDASALASARGVEGHRARLRARLLNGGGSAISDYELLELILFLALPRRDTKPLARDLLRRYGSLGNAIAAPVAQLRTVHGMGQASVAGLKIVVEAARRLLRAEILDRPVFSGMEGLLDYLHAVMAREPVEQLRVLYLDSRNRLIADEAQAFGSVNHVYTSAREVVRLALDKNASALILAHNHPSGDPTPSAEDVEMTREIDKCARLMSIVLHDHVIIGNGRSTSLRSLGVFDD